MLDLGSAKALHAQADRLLWAIGLIETLRPSFAEDHISAYSLICSEALELWRVIPATTEDVPSGFRDPIESISRVVKWLKIAGYDSESRLDFGSGCPTVPDGLKVLLRDATTKLSESLRVAEDDQEHAREIERAQREGVLDEYVRRSPGKGALRSIGPIVDQQFDSHSLDEGPVSWTEATIFKYSNERWFICEDRYHREVSMCLGTTTREVTEAAAARFVLDSDLDVDVATIAWAKRAAAKSETGDGTTNEAIANLPEWDSEIGELRFRGAVVRKVNRRAQNVRKLLNCFQESQWEKRIDSPWPDSEQGKETLRETVRSLNNGCNGVTFASDGAGQGAIWEAERVPDPWPF